jgi:hypothetical protein
MKTMKLFLGLILSTILLTSCYREEVIITNANSGISLKSIIELL